MAQGQVINKILYITMSNLGDAVMALPAFDFGPLAVFPARPFTGCGGAAFGPSNNGKRSGPFCNIRRNLTAFPEIDDLTSIAAFFISANVA